MKDNNDKNIYEMLNDIDIDLSEYDREDFNDIEKIKINKRFKQSISKKTSINSYKKYVSVASVAVISLIIISFTPVGTYASKIISDLVFDIKSALRVDEDKGNYIKVVNKEITKEGITLRLNEAVLNNDELVVSLTTMSKNEIPKDTKIWRDKPAKLYINGELIESMNISSGINVSKNNIDEVLFFNINTKKYSGLIHIKIEIDDIGIYIESNDKIVKEDTVEGPFIFEFDFDTTKLNKNMRNINLSKVIDFGNGELISLNKFVYTPLSQKIYYSKNDKAIKSEVKIFLKGKDDLGNEVEFEMYGEKNGVGELIASINGGQIDESAKYLTLTAYKRTDETNNGVNESRLEKIEKDIKIDIVKRDK